MNLLNLPTEILHEILSYIICQNVDEVLSTSSKYEQYHPKNYIRIRSTCKFLKTLADTPSAKARHFTTKLRFSNTVCSHEADNIYSSHYNDFRSDFGEQGEREEEEEEDKSLHSPVESRYGDKGLRELQMVVNGIRFDVFPVWNITKLYILEPSSVILAPLAEFDTEEWKVFLSRLKELYVKFKPIVEEYDCMDVDETGAEVYAGEKGDDMDRINDLFEDFRKQVLSWPQHLTNLEAIGLEFSDSFAGKSVRFRALFADVTTMPKLETVELSNCIFGREFLTFIVSKRKMLRNLNLRKCRPIVKSRLLAAEIEDGLNNEDVLFSEVYENLLKLDLLIRYGTFSGYIRDASGTQASDSPGYQELLEKGKENSRRAGSYADGSGLYGYGFFQLGPLGLSW